ncbi:MAG: NAD-dependent epimerase/dehydratase family protein [Patescibacteria group bacterium]
MKKLKIFLTGGGGFIGRNILEMLGDKHDFLSPGRSDLDLTNADSVFDYLKNNNVDVVIHAANVGGNRNPKWTGVDWVSEKNLQMFFNLVRCKDFYKRMIVLGSGAEYDKRRDVTKVKEDDFDNSMPVDQYGFAKYIMSKYAQNVDFITHLRLFAVYGKYEDYKIRFISEAICDVLLGKPIIINQNVYFDYLYINDFVKILDNFIVNKPKQTFYNVGRGETIDLISIAKKILVLTGKNVPVIIKNAGLNKEYSGNIDRLKSEAKNLSFTDFDKSLTELIVYYQSIASELNNGALI